MSPPKPTEKEVKRHLRKLVDSVRLSLTKIDMWVPFCERSGAMNRECGAQIAAIANQLEMAADSAARFGLGETHAQAKKRKAEIPAADEEDE